MDPTREEFEKAKRAFCNKIKDRGLYEDILTTTTIADVYKTTSKLQEEFAKKGRHHWMGKISPFLDRLRDFDKVIDVCVSVKPDVLALIWGPLKLLLIWSGEVDAAHDKILDTLVRIGYTLPQFAVVAEVFEDNKMVKAALVLFYEDILHFYRVSFDFFNKSCGLIFQLVIRECCTDHSKKRGRTCSNLCGQTMRKRSIG